MTDEMKNALLRAAAASDAPDVRDLLDSIPDGEPKGKSLLTVADSYIHELIRVLSAKTGRTPDYAPTYQTMIGMHVREAAQELQSLSNAIADAMEILDYDAPKWAEIDAELEDAEVLATEGTDTGESEDERTERFTRERAERLAVRLATAAGMVECHTRNGSAARTKVRVNLHDGPVVGTASVSMPQKGTAGTALGKFSTYPARRAGKADAPVTVTTPTE